MAIGWWQIVIVVILAVLLFGRGKISDLMGDVAKGIKSFRKGMSDDDSIPPIANKSSSSGEDTTANASSEKTKKDD